MEVREHAREFEDSFARGQWNNKAARTLKGVSGVPLVLCVYFTLSQHNMSYKQHKPLLHH